MQLIEHRWAINTSVRMPDQARHSFSFFLHTTTAEAILIEQDLSRSSAAEGVIQPHTLLQPNAFHVRQIACPGRKWMTKESVSSCTEWRKNGIAGFIGGTSLP